ncbi:hypothetical protein HNQ07_000190 [Deinococcus metalli]|uniref:Uncharacterized protein n=1 Tax=Deinococcus metalli TaxID=1141878 RepID=A0A7W8KCY7_9DEIO|nr:hypothetical protein [Deinococcus metalli]MBB5374746.1 hypothetical protein [Deinococcus metalli]GHF34010.1 hypothetical protein GCM10017781_08530 [Deinococcus metalli]
MLRELKGWLRRRADRGAEPSPRRDGRDDREGGAGVPVPAGPRPRRDGVQARPPEPVTR